MFRYHLTRGGEPDDRWNFDSHIWEMPPSTRHYREQVSVPLWSVKVKLGNTHTRGKSLWRRASQNRHNRKLVNYNYNCGASYILQDIILNMRRPSSTPTASHLQLDPLFLPSKDPFCQVSIWSWSVKGARSFEDKSVDGRSEIWTNNLHEVENATLQRLTTQSRLKVLCICVCVMVFAYLCLHNCTCVFVCVYLYLCFCSCGKGSDPHHTDA